MIAALLTITVAVVYVGSVVVVRHRAQAAADLAALAAAGRLVDGAASACASASVVARAMQTTVRECTIVDLDVVVTVEAPAALGRFATAPIRVSARAGPAQ